MRANDIKNAKKDFSFFKKREGIVYLDNSLTTLIPDRVVNKMSQCFTNNLDTLGGGETKLVNESWKLFDDATLIIAKFYNVLVSEVIFCAGGGTLALNLIAHMTMNELKKNDAIILGDMEHASNILPFQKLAREKGIEIKYYKIDPSTLEIDYEHLKKLNTEDVKLISLSSTYNISGIQNDIKKVKDVMQEKIVIVDGIQSGLTKKIDLKESNVDFFISASHKMFGPNGIAMIYIKKSLQDKLTPFILGGKMQKQFNRETIVYSLDKYKFMPGSFPVCLLAGFSEAIKYINDFNLENIISHGIELATLLKKELEKLPNVQIYNKSQKTSTVTFSIKGTLGYDVAYILSQRDIYVRSGHMCVSDDNGVYNSNKTLRASFSIYNTTEDVRLLIEAIKKEKDFSTTLFVPRDDRKCE